jgi:hypothetical protein
MYQAATVCGADHLHQFVKIMYAAVSSRIADRVGRIWLCQLLLHVFRNLRLCPSIMLGIFHNQKSICLGIKTNKRLNINDLKLVLAGSVCVKRNVLVF